jgi:hypothetical protein
MSSSSSQPPTFIVGSGRSGTTLLRLMLDAHPDISCGPETHFLRDLRHLVGEHWNLLSRYGFDKAYWHNKIHYFFDSFKEDYMERRGKQRWVEKTPWYVRYLDFLDDVFDGCLIIHIIRNGYDVVRSWKERSGYLQALKSAWTGWGDSIRQARAFGQTYPERFHELRYEDLVTSPEPTIRSVLSFMDEPWEPVVLDYDQVDHDVADQYWDLTKSRREEQKDSSKIYASRIGTGKDDLDAGLRNTLRMRSGGLLQELGYE